VKGYCVLDASCSVKNWLGRRSHVVALVVAVLSVNSAATQEILFLFNIPAQRLAVALEQYSAVTGRDLLYNSNLAAGRQSNRVQGRLSADGALGLLLEGTGLSRWPYQTGELSDCHSFPRRCSRNGDAI
jgi:hypothetical protein